MATSSKFTVGQEVTLVSAYMRPARRQRVTVVKIARKYLYVSGRSDKFDPETGKIVDSYGHHWLKTDEEIAREEACENARKKLEAYGFPGLWQMKNDKMVAAYNALKSAGLVD